MSAPASPQPATRRYGGDGVTSPVERYVWYPVVVPPPAPPVRSLPARRVVVLGGSDTTRAGVVSALQTAGAQTTLVPRGTDADTPEQVAGLATAAVLAAGAVDLIVDLTPEPPFAPTRHQVWRRALAQTVAVLQAVEDDWSRESDARRCGYLAVTWMGGRMGYDGQGVAQPLGGIWSGLAKSLPHELPACSLKVLDLAADEAARVGPLVVAEAGVWDYYEIGWRGGVRATLGCGPVPVPVPRLSLKPGDVVLVSGGGRGVGFALARFLAHTTGCRVVVTGRRPLVWDGSRGAQDALDDQQFRDLLDERLRSAVGAGNLADVRRENLRLTDARTIRRNLEEARAAGLDLEYRPCDVLDPQQVARLVDDLGDRLRIVVHNAGVADPVRLRRKSVQGFLDVVACKLEGFVCLAEALQGRSVDLLCNVGSAAGRLGGMPGQIDYAAANEVLSRLGFWAGEQRGLPVTTCAWTTWERLGLIGNFDAALRYGAAVKVEEGVQRWSAELLGGQPGEVMFLGRVGTALVPSQLAGFLKLSDHPDLARLHSLHHWLGEVEEYVPFRRIRSRNRVQSRAPLSTEVSLGRRPLLPVSVALEYAASVGDWVVPEGWPPCRLAELRALEVRLDALAMPEDGLELVKRGQGVRVDGRWSVDVSLQRADDGREMLRTTLVYALEPSGTVAATPEVDPAVAAPPAGSGVDSELTWAGVIFPTALPWCGRDRAGWFVRPTAPADVWPMPLPPRHALPSAALETVLREEGRAAGPETPHRLDADRVVLHRRGAEDSVQRVETGDWYVRDAAGRPLLQVVGLVLS